MILYKNVDIKDLDSILQSGILSLNECKNNNWRNGKRSNNSCDVVYLFDPLTEQNSFCNYGVALLEVEIPGDKVKENEFGKCDVNKGKYAEYIADKVDSIYIKRIFIPELFKDRINCNKVSNQTLSKVLWCGFAATYYGDNGKEHCPDNVLSQFAKTAQIMDSTTFNFFRGKMENREVIDLYDIRYVF